MDHERDDLNEMLGSLPPSMPTTIQFAQQKFHHHQGLLKASNYGDLLENDQNMYEGMITSNGSPIVSPAAAAAANLLPSKRTHHLPAMYWSEDPPSCSGSSPLTKKFLNDDSHVTAARTDDQSGGGSIATLLSQLPQQNVLGGLGGGGGDAVFRQPYQVSGMNWYS